MGPVLAAVFVAEIGVGRFPGERMDCTRFEAAHPNQLGNWRPHARVPGTREVATSKPQGGLPFHCPDRS